MAIERPVKLLERLEEKGITRKTLADVAGVTERAVYRWLSYEVEPKLTLTQVASLCELLEWGPRELADAYYSDVSESQNPKDAE